MVGGDISILYVRTGPEQFSVTPGWLSPPLSCPPCLPPGGRPPPRPRKSFIPSPSLPRTGAEQRFESSSEKRVREISARAPASPRLCLSSQHAPASTYLQGLAPSNEGSSVSWKRDFYVGKCWWRAVGYGVSCAAFERTKELQPKPGFWSFLGWVVVSSVCASPVKWGRSFSQSSPPQSSVEIVEKAWALTSD